MGKFTAFSVTILKNGTISADWIIYMNDQDKFTALVLGYLDIDVLVQEIRNSMALAVELRLSCTKPSICAEMITTPGL